MLWKKISKLRIKAEMFDGWEDVERVVHHQGLFHILEIIKTELTTKKTRELIIRKYCRDLQLLLIPTHCRKSTSYNLILVIVGLLMKMIYYKPAQIIINATILAAGYLLLSSTAIIANASPTKKILALL